jgi:hypothetical protein
MFHVRRVLTQGNLSSATYKQLKFFLASQTGPTTTINKTPETNKKIIKPSPDSIILSDSAIKVNIAHSLLMLKSR